MSATSARKIAFFSIALVVILFDQLTKELAIAFLQPGFSKPFIGELVQFRLAFNDSAAFSLGVGATWVLAIIAIIAVLVLIWFGPKAKTLVWSVISAFVLGGAAGNLIDRLTREPGFLNGHVVDFIQIPFNFPIFNIADSFLVIGVSLAILRTLLGDELGGGRAE
ncbi:signal peptidase II [Aquiluna borgnonia]|uniref:Lipoprotein signal peptidase n=1 Tax=Aquiluna borgnonia TaxID=2499157 RepID=A0A7D4UAW6_9MICO|nr:signal peptidase II [Aquiluna borgnonia]QKJ25377.1 signal peptidase II [Aquiluna borgnonia]